MWRQTCSSSPQPLLSPPLWWPMAGSSRCQRGCRKQHRRLGSQPLTRTPFSSLPGCADKPRRRKRRQQLVPSKYWMFVCGHDVLVCEGWVLKASLMPLILISDINLAFFRLTSSVKYPVTIGATTPGMVPKVLVIPRRNPAYLQETGENILLWFLHNTKTVKEGGGNKRFTSHRL